MEKSRLLTHSVPAKLGRQLTTSALVFPAVVLALIANGAVAFAALPAKENLPPAALAIRMFGLTLFAAYVLLIKAGAVAGAVTLSALCPTAANRVRSTVAARPLAVFFLGLADALAGGLVVLSLGHLSRRFPTVGLISLALLVGLIGLTVYGLTGVYGRVGERFRRGDEAGASDVLKGGLALELATLIPLLGWLAQAIVLCMGLGAGTLALLSTRKEEPAA